MGLVRLLVYLVIGYLIYRLIRMFLATPDRRAENSSPPGESSNRLEKDPVCGVYISRATAIRESVDGKEIFFCSRNCAEKFISDSNQKD